jgi:hypothetical protein
MKFKEHKIDLKIEMLNQNFDLSTFDCGDEDLNDFLKNDALIEQQKKIKCHSFNNL